MKKKIAIGAVLIALLLAGGVLWYTRPRSFWGDHWDLRERRLLRRPASVRVLGG